MKAAHTVSLRAPSTQPTHIVRTRATRTTLKPLHRLTRAHAALAQRPQLRQQGDAVLKSVSEALQHHLGAPVALSAALHDATIHPFSHLAQSAVFVIFELSARTLAVLELEPTAGAWLLHHTASTAETGCPPSSLSRIEEAALGWLFLVVLAAVRSAAPDAPWNARLVGVSLSRGDVLRMLDVRQRTLAFELALTSASFQGRARLLIPTLAAQALVQTVEVPATSAMAASVGQAQLDVRCRLHGAPLVRELVDALSEGDVIMLGDAGRTDEGFTGTVSLVASSFTLVGRLGANGFTLTRCAPHPTPQESHTMETTLVPLDVEVELTRIRIPVGQLGVLQPGGVLPLHINAAQTVTLRIGDRAVANAELVDIEGELGARILSLL